MKQPSHFAWQSGEILGHGWTRLKCKVPCDKIEQSLLDSNAEPSIRQTHMHSCIGNQTSADLPYEPGNMTFPVIQVLIAKWLTAGHNEV